MGELKHEASGHESGQAPDVVFKKNDACELPEKKRDARSQETLVHKEPSPDIKQAWSVTEDGMSGAKTTVRALRADFEPMTLETTSTISRQLCGQRASSFAFKMVVKPVPLIVLGLIWLLGAVVLCAAMCGLVPVEAAAVFVLAPQLCIVVVIMSMNTEVVALLWAHSKFNLLYLAANIVVLFVCIALTSESPLATALWMIGTVSSFFCSLFMDAVPASLRYRLGLVFFIMNLAGLSFIITMVQLEWTPLEDTTFPMGPFVFSALSLVSSSALTLIIFGARNLVTLIRHPERLVVLRCGVTNTKTSKAKFAGLVQSQHRRSIL